MAQTRDMIIVGAGPGGLTAGLYAARMGLKVIILETGISGGRMINAWEIENYPGYETISGKELATKMKTQTEKAGAEIQEMTTVEKFQLKGPMKVLITSEGDEFHAPVIVLAMGTCDIQLGVPGESEYQGQGISYCATCDGPLFRDRTVVVVGGGNTAAMDALFLANVVKKVYLVHRRDQLRAEKAYAEKLQQLPNVEILWDTIMIEVIGKEVVASVKLKNKKTGQEWIQPVDGVFIAVGCQPNSSVVEPAGVRLDKHGNVMVDEHQQTNIPGVYAIGDITGEPRQIVRACGDAVKAVTHWMSVRPT